MLIKRRANDTKLLASVSCDASIRNSQHKSTGKDKRMQADRSKRLAAATRAFHAVYPIRGVMASRDAKLLGTCARSVYTRRHLCSGHPSTYSGATLPMRVMTYLSRAVSTVKILKWVLTELSFAS